MRVLEFSVENFGSYQQLIYNPCNMGLTLIAGPTGSGKSTFCDIIPWIIFGKTAKGGSVDEVRSWNSSAPTAGYIKLDLGAEHIIIQRTRGTKTNDLSFTLVNRPDHDSARGKDLTDTQKQINQILGMDCETFLAGAYFHEFSQTAAFFTANAKVRRTICEQLVDLSLAKKVKASIQELKSDTTKKVSSLETELSRLDNSIQIITATNAKNKESITIWEKKRQEDRNELLILLEQWEHQKAKREETVEQQRKDWDSKKQDKLLALRVELKRAQQRVKSDVYFESIEEELANKFKELKHVCLECGQPVESEERVDLERDQRSLNADRLDSAAAKERASSLSKQIDALNKEKYIQPEHNDNNPYLDQIEKLDNKENPFKAKKETPVSELIDEQILLKSALSTAVQYFEDLEALQDLVDVYRMKTISSVITGLEDSTNKLLTEHFDGEITIKFDTTQDDKIDVVIYKDGNECVYTQLSKGQRQLLKLCFGVSVMAVVANTNGINFEQIFFDEALDGLSEEFKIKAYGLLQTLAQQHDSIFVVEHSQELKNLFENQIKVQLVDGKSVINE